MELRVVNLYPEQMNIYADRGNLIFLGMRCRWRGLGFTVDGCGVGEGFDPESCDLLYIGGGQDRDQEIVGRDLVQNKIEAIRAAFEAGKAILAVCGGYQLLGRSWETETGSHEGLGLIDMETVRTREERLIGPVLIETDFGGNKLEVAGFENHGGRTYLGSGVSPFGKVLRGYGNNGKDGYEGATEGNLVGTYLHGPLLPKNYLLADRLLEAALVARYGEGLELIDLDDSAETVAHDSAVRAALTSP
jgi:CobQ-like glutamine amidotransferase family enzyme